MNKSLIAGVVVGALVVTAGGAIAGFDLFDRKPQFAEVVDVDPVAENVRTPREVCEDRIVTRPEPVKDGKRVTGTAIGAVVGGVLGSQVGSGDGRKAATAAGAAAGGYAGNRVQQRMQAGNTRAETESACNTVYDASERIVGYNVRYRLGNEEGTVRMSNHPGSRIPVKDGELVIDGVRS